MDKATINTEFVAMRKAVGQARVHIIRKLVREINVLKEKAPKTADLNLQEKYKQKTKKLGDVIIAIKNLKDFDYVSKHALTSENNHTKDLSDPNSTSEARALARLCLHKSVAQRVLNFKAKFNHLDKSIEEMLATGKKKQKKLQHIQAKNERKQRKKEINSEETMRAGWLKNNALPHSKDDEGLESKRMEVSVEVKASTENQNDNVPSPNIEASKVVKNLQSNKKIRKETSHIQKSTKIVHSSEDSDQNSSDDSQETESQYGEKFIEQRDNFKTDFESKQSTEKTVDSFFITDSGDNYLSTYVPKLTKVVETSVLLDGLNRRERRAHQFGKVVKPKKNKFSKEKISKGVSNFTDNTTRLHINNGEEIHKTTMSNNKFNKKQNVFHSDSNKESGQIINNQHKQKSNVSAKLHPSWEAKKKAPQILPFQGKKITFDD